MGLCPRGNVGTKLLLLLLLLYDRACQVPSCWRWGVLRGQLALPLAEFLLYACALSLLVRRLLSRSIQVRL